MREALKRRATLGEVSDVLREVFGEYQPEPVSRSRHGASGVPVSALACEALPGALVASEVDHRPRHGHGAVEHGTICRRARAAAAAKPAWWLTAGKRVDAEQRDGWRGWRARRCPCRSRRTGSPSAAGQKTRPRDSALAR